MKINDRTTCNFEHPENFVVFECVHRLLEKGYRPEHIELERRWTLGHEQKSGKADIIVTDNDGKTLLIIECKTAGQEYGNARKTLFDDGGQLFSYWQQEGDTQWLALYASDFDDNTKTLSYKDTIVSCADDKNTILTAKTDDGIKLYNKAHTMQELFATWQETYNQQTYEGLIFGPDSTAYNIGIKPLRKADLRGFNNEDKIVNRFEEILRHNNVSDKENAFNRLVALFICKLVDEINKKDNDEVEFQYKQGSDDYETLQDRLQRLHRDGMQQFMREDISYVEYDYAEKLFEQYHGRQRKNAIADLKNTIRILKFYSNNDFAFKDVHNEELFLQNGKVLVEMVQLFQPFRIVYPSRNQLLGDLFEQLLNKGFKQNEGQFFTPMPITRFIWDCLPLTDLTRRIGNSYPRIVDFACGAGHFLTEAVEAVNHFVHTSDRENRWAEEAIYGIEKDYRLARVARVSLYMNGAGRGNIIFGDGLDNHTDKGVCPASFDILVANPPYAVKGFKGYLRLKDNELTTLHVLSNDSGDIQVPFVERIAQLLKPRGFAAVVLPSSILSNGDKGATAARDILLRNFLLRGIAQFGSKTFGATGTNTVVLFLEKYNEPPRRCEMVADSVNAILGGQAQADWDEHAILADYLQRIGVGSDDYATFTAESRTLGEWDGVAYFKQYAEAFRKEKSYKDIIKRKDFAKQKNDEQQKRLTRAFYAYAKPIERAKIEAFALTRGQTTVVATAPAGNNEQERYLGYSWSNAKGSEGIRITDPYSGALYDDRNRESDNCVAAALRHSFTDPDAPIPSAAEPFCKTVATADMLDFSRAAFSNAITPNVAKKVEVKSKWPMVRLGDIADVQKGTSITSSQIVAGNIKVIAGGRDFAYMHNASNRPAKTITVSASGAYAGFVNYWDEPIYASDCNTIRGKDDSHTLYLYHYLSSIQDLVHALQKGSAQPHVYADDLKNLPVPEVNIDVQQKIVSACSAIDAEYAQAKQTIENKKQEIEQFVSGVTAENMVQLKDVCSYSNERIDYSSIAPDSYISTDNMLQDCEGIKAYEGTPNIDSVVRYKVGDILVSNIRPYLMKIWHADRDGGCSPDVLVFQCNNNIDDRYVYYEMKCKAFFEHMMKGRKGVKMPRGDKQQTMQFAIPLSPLDVQRSVVSHVEELEAEIAGARQLMAGCAARKQAVLHEYL